ncbi:sodium-dependent bicarbonate transport family permease [Microcella daejeonensis]|uniref:Sodium-dependent bicarbonate transport family permease n=1 Tax=Microcella daejeonensis TaxID=2994971 RepID=A0A9E8S9V6_9MICO|nr:sodium-dependent bicarbonate transport family permease [Microcella daejeonensis]WAB82444.1 sodium-dependent bicarbonate transport family permease [Microcella daejeonensis]
MKTASPVVDEADIRAHPEESAMTLDLLSATLLSPAVLAFLLGMIAVAVRSDLAVPDTMVKALSLYLLLAIGIKGGVALRAEDPATIAGPLLLAAALGVVIPLLAFGALGALTRLDRAERGAIAAHYGSTSLVTFTAALTVIAAAGVAVPGYAPALLAVLEVPGIIVGILLARRAVRTTAAAPARRRVLVGAGRSDEADAPDAAGGPGSAPTASAPASPATPLRRTLHEVFTGTSVVLLVGGIVIGAVLGPEGMAPIAPLVVDAFPGVLVLFLLAMGLAAGAQLPAARRGGPGLLLFALLFPLLAGAIGVVAGTAIGMGVGGAAVLGVLCASASYIAAPAAVRVALPEVPLALPLAASLGVTFPLNLVAGIPILLLLAQSLGG